MLETDVHKVRPAGRHILTIGRDLIQDRYAAIVELVKNSYDADSPDVNLEFKTSTDHQVTSICIEDHGHGMSRDTVINKWMVPSTDDKLLRQKSPGGRIMQGRKGVGRYAASILGADLLLETVTADRAKTTVYIQWDRFADAQYLDDVDVLVETKTSEDSPGTRLTISGGQEFVAAWDKSEFDKLRFELKKLISPVSVRLTENDDIDRFKIQLSIIGFFETDIFTEVIEPYPVFELFDYRIAGRVTAGGTGSLQYSNQKVRNTVHEDISFDLGSPSECGELVFDIRVYDREPQAIELLIHRGLKDETGTYVGKNQARKLLNDYNGVGVYRNGFRIRPLGDADFDWLKLNEQRVQNPSLRIGSNQAIGYVLIQSEEQSGLVEKSARDGLREDAAFQKLKAITKKVIGELEVRRFEYRRNEGLSRPVVKIERELERLFGFEELKSDVRAKLSKGGIDDRITDEIISIISKDEEQKNKIAEDIRRAVAIYQGQATLGKIVNVVLHEGRRPLNYFKNQIPNLRFWYDQYVEYNDSVSLQRLLSIADGIGHNAEILVRLFGRLDPLAAGRRSAKQELPLKRTIEEVFAVFHSDFQEHKITVDVVGPEDFRFECWRQDIYAIFTNLADNSLFWMKEKASGPRAITVTVYAEEGRLQYVDYRDTGPGIEPHLIETEVIFEPEFSTKPDGTGLGLAIAGEAASRNGLELEVLESTNGAYFRLQPKGE
ncbi:MAG TPA: sensor histidine kinase [Pyrinomonadaceae bacterium]|nr:sensor histidine kinase [Pyrinomonadaceae bacterium]